MGAPFHGFCPVKVIQYYNESALFARDIAARPCLFEIRSRS